MTTREQIERFVNKYTLNSGDCFREAITDYIYLDKEKIQQDLNEILEFYMKNFDINSSCISYLMLTSTSEGFQYLPINCHKDLLLLEKLIAIGYQANIFIDDYSTRYIQYVQLGSMNKYLIPSEFDYLDEEYYYQLEKVLNKLLLIVNTALLERGHYRNMPDAELLKRWFLDGLNESSKAVASSYDFMENPDIFAKMASMIEYSPYTQQELFEEMEGIEDRSFYNNLCAKYYYQDPCDQSLKQDEVENFLYDLDDKYTKGKTRKNTNKKRN
jgi:hypothetical protein